MVLVTGGAGYIGSHTCVMLMEAGHEVVVFDNLSNASKESLRRVEKIVGRAVPFVEGDIRSADDLEAVFRDYDITSVIHFAGLKAVGESVVEPGRYRLTVSGASPGARAVALGAPKPSEAVITVQ